MHRPVGWYTDAQRKPHLLENASLMSQRRAKQTLNASLQQRRSESCLYFSFTYDHDSNLNKNYTKCIPFSIMSNTHNGISVLRISL